jgi:hypothetical protein
MTEYTVMPKLDNEEDIKPDKYIEKGNLEC